MPTIQHVEQVTTSINKVLRHLDSNNLLSVNKPRAISLRTLY